MLGISKLRSIRAVSCLVLILPAGAWAGQKHLGYSHAADDLRLVRTVLQRPNGAHSAADAPNEVSLAIGNIESAINQIDKALGPENRKPQEMPKIDARMPWAERLAQGLRLLERAELDCYKEKDDSQSAGLKARVFDQLDQAHTRLSVAVQTVNFDYSARNIPTRND